MPEPSLDPTSQTRLVSTLLLKMGDQSGYLVRLHPVAVGEGVITLPRGRAVIGRDAGCEIAVTDTDVSRQHACIELLDGQYVLRDLGSTNGTLVNDRKIKGPEVLVSGCRVSVGKVIFKFLRGDDVEKQYHETVYTMMISDGLTGIANKRYFQEAFRRELARSQRHRRPLSVAVLDLDHFKKVNDTYGHLAGDAVLREVAARVRDTIRSDEVFARFGGEEFVILLPEASLEQARAFAERVRKLVADAPVTGGDAPIPVTVSIGVAHTQGESGVTMEELLARADRKLYEAKAGGRNRVAG